jgi:hypothetical protein
VTVVLFVLLVVFLCISIWAISDAALRPSKAFVAVSESKPQWITLIAGGTLFLGIVGPILAIFYLFSIRPKVRNGRRETLTKSPVVASRRPWNYFAVWMLVGGAYAMVIAGAFTIGIFFIPPAVIATIFLVRKPSSRRGFPGLFAGLALPLFFVAYLNRSGPGLVCTTSQSTFGVSNSCGQEWNPWLFLAAGLILLGVGAGVFIIVSRRNGDRRCSKCSQVLGPEANFCPSCGTQSIECQGMASSG